nr:MAG TPA: hypothetical protein [Caudoviricetes sp.]
MVKLPRLANLGLLCGFGSIFRINFIFSFKIHQPNLKNCVRKNGLAGEILYVIRPKSDAYF